MSIVQGVRGLRLPEFGGFQLTLNVALTTVLRTNVLHCDIIKILAPNGGFFGVSRFSCIREICVRPTHVAMVTGKFLT